MQNIDVVSTMTIAADDVQEITLNFFDIANIIKNSEKTDADSGRKFSIITIKFRDKSTTVPMQESDYRALVSNFSKFTRYLLEHPENHQLRAINAVIGESVSDIIKSSISEHVNARNNIEENMLQMQEAFGKKLEEYTLSVVSRFEKSQTMLDERLKSINELYEKLNKVSSLVDDFLIAENQLDNNYNIKDWDVSEVTSLPDFKE